MILNRVNYEQKMSDLIKIFSIRMIPKRETGWQKVEFKEINYTIPIEGIQVLVKADSIDDALSIVEKYFEDFEAESIIEGYRKNG